MQLSFLIRVVGIWGALPFLLHKILNKTFRTDIWVTGFFFVIYCIWAYTLIDAWQAEIGFNGVRILKDKASCAV